MKNPGFLFETKTGRRGRTYNREKLINGKFIVHLYKDGTNQESGEKLLVGKESGGKVIGYIE
jgi:hypothetical protein